MTLIDERALDRLPPPDDDEPAEPSGPPSRSTGKRNVVA
jgi:hypothetical protein